MPSTYSNTGLELMADGEKSGTWGQITNENWQMMEEMVAGIVSISLTSTTYTLTTSDGALSVGRHAVLVFSDDGAYTPSAACTVTVSPNDMQKVYFIVNNSAEDVIISQGTGANVTIAAGSKGVVYCDGAGTGAAVVDLNSGVAINATSFSLAGVGVTATAAELNVLDGITATTAELNKLDGYLGSVTELNYLKDLYDTGVTSTEFDYLDGVTSNVQTQINALSTTAGTHVEKTSATGSAVVPAGTTVQQDVSPSAGYLRFNTQNAAFEGYNGSAWGSLGGATGAGGDQVFYENDQHVTTSYTITSGKNAMTTGEITIDSGAAVTVPSGSRWVIL